MMSKAVQVSSVGQDGQGVDRGDPPLPETRGPRGIVGGVFEPFNGAIFNLIARRDQAASIRVFDISDTEPPETPATSKTAA